MTNVTITGADDNTPIDRMVELSRRFSFLEWGILFSVSRTGTPRYPSIGWVNALKRQGLDLAAHVCGSLGRVVMSGVASTAFYVSPPDGFRRVQFNGYALGSALRLPRIPPERRDDFEYILQAPDDVMVAGCSLDAQKAQVRCSVLFDPSGGRGVGREGRWPRVLPGTRMGYAGGFGPDNVAQEIASISAANGGRPPAWVDMESRVRDSDDRLDLGAVAAVCEAVDRANVDAFVEEMRRS